jgi:hypothetical protein
MVSAFGRGDDGLGAWVGELGFRVSVVGAMVPGVGCGSQVFGFRERGIGLRASTRRTTDVSGPLESARYVTKFAPHQALKSIALRQVGFPPKGRVVHRLARVGFRGTSTVTVAPIESVPSRYACGEKIRVSGLGCRG